MSETPSVVTEAHFRYLTERTAPEDGFLLDLKKAAREAGIPSIWISPDEASFVQILLKLCGAREVVDVGTLAGYSAIRMARALPPGGHVRTIEINPAFADFAEKWIAKSDVADRIEVLRGDARKILPGLKGGEVDAMLLDADKIGYPIYLGEALRLLRKGGLLLVDNAFAFGQLFDKNATDPETPAVRKFNEIMAGTKEFHSIIVPLGDGCWVGVKE